MPCPTRPCQEKDRRGWKRPQLETSLIRFVWPQWNTKAPLSAAMDPTQAAPKRDWQSLICIGMWMRRCSRIHPKSSSSWEFSYGMWLLVIFTCDEKTQFQCEVTTEVFYGECECAMIIYDYLRIRLVSCQLLCLQTSSFEYQRSWVVGGFCGFCFMGAFQDLNQTIWLLFIAFHYFSILFHLYIILYNGW